MILELFAILLLLSFYIIWIGFRYDDNGFRIVGFFFIFLLSLVLISNSLSYQTGAIINTNNASTTTIINQYTNYTDSSSHWIGYFLAIISSLGMIFSWMYPPKGDIRR